MVSMHRSLNFLSDGAMSGHPNSSQPITQLRFEEVQEAAKASAREALKRGSPKGLTALGLAYYEKFSRESVR